MSNHTFKAFAKKAVPKMLLRNLRAAIDYPQRQLARRRNMAKGSYVPTNAHVLGWRSVRVGRNSVIGDGAILNVNHRNRPIVQISIGHSTFVGARSFFSPAELIEIGDYGLVGIDCKFLGSGHIFSDPFKPYISTGTGSEGRMIIGTNCWIGVGVTILGSVTVGHGSVIGAGSFVRSDIPPFSIAVGNPARVLRRYDPIGQDWVAAADFTDAMAAALPDAASYLATLERAYPNISVPVRAAGKSQGDLA